MNLVKATKAFVKLPFSVRTMVMRHFFNRLLGRQSTNHHAIWTSFLYFSIDHDLAVTEELESYAVSFRRDDVNNIYHLRKFPSSDIFVFFQILIAKGYDPLFEFIEKKGIELKNIVDAGANIGLFSLETISRFRQCTIQAIEPDLSNFDAMKLNIDSNHAASQVCLHQKAIWSSTTTSLKLLNKEDWSTRVVTSETGESGVNGITLRDIFAECGWESLDLLKMDVEGTEGILFADADFLDLLTRIKIVALEIHDQICDREAILSALRANHFVFFQSGELTVAWNTKFIR